MTASPASRRILYLGTGSTEQVFSRNGANLFLERECSDFSGYFAEMWNVHFPAGARGEMDLTPRHHLVDFDVRLPACWSRLPLLGLLIRELAFLRWVIAFARRRGISVVTATNPHLQGLNAALLSAALRIPYAVIITRDYDWDWRVLRKRAFPSVFPARWVEKLVARAVLARAALVLADREYYRAFAVRNGAAPSRTVVTRVLADTAYERARPNPSLRARLGLTDGPLLTYVGRLDPDKLPLDLVDCLAFVRRRFPTARLACAGRGTMEQAMSDRATEHGVAEGLHLLGSLPLHDLADLLASSDVGLAAHMGYTLPEVGLTGTPIVTYDYDWHAEVLRDGERGMLAPFRDVAALADRVCALLADPALARRVGWATREYLQREHTLARVVPMYQAAYNTILPLPDTP